MWQLLGCSAAFLKEGMNVGIRSGMRTWVSDVALTVLATETRPLSLIHDTRSSSGSAGNPGREEVMEMKKLLPLAAIVAFGASLCGTAMGVDLDGQVWLHTGEEAACAMVFLYDDIDCDEYLDQVPMDSCGYYKFTGLSDDRSYWVHIEFPILQCTMGSYYGTCPETEIECEEVEIPEFSSGVTKHWYLGLSECFNIGCP